MKPSQLHIIIGSIFLAPAFLTEGTTSLILLCIGAFWFISGILFMLGERDIERLEMKSEHLKFKIITDLLFEIAGRKKKVRKYKPLKRRTKR